mmetsp:Transcript_117941/g.205311  ORF Transcript_117941/g.205311 Transcript_117941/m.205311 type:complete len:103 (-) Transcript_117941:42-350(-)
MKTNLDYTTPHFDAKFITGEQWVFTMKVSACLVDGEYAETNQVALHTCNHPSQIMVHQEILDLAGAPTMPDMVAASVIQPRYKPFSFPKHAVFTVRHDGAGQ